MIKSLFNKISENLPVVAILLVATLVSGWASNTYLVDPEGTEALLTEQGYTNIKIGKHAWIGCDSDYPFSVDTEFNATNPQGKNVSGAYCDGIRPYLVTFQKRNP